MQKIASSMTKSALAEKYNIHVNTLREWLKSVPNLEMKPFQKVLNPKQLEHIYRHLGEP
jgi:hypothetical protein